MEELQPAWPIDEQNLRPLKSEDENIARRRIVGLLNTPATREQRAANILRALVLSFDAPPPSFQGLGSASGAVAWQTAKDAWAIQAARKWVYEEETDE